MMPALKLVSSTGISELAVSSSFAIISIVRELLRTSQWLPTRTCCCCGCWACVRPGRACRVTDVKWCRVVDQWQTGLADLLAARQLSCRPSDVPVNKTTIAVAATTTITLYTFISREWS